MTGNRRAATAIAAAVLLLGLVFSYPAGASYDGGFHLQWGLHKIGAEKAWETGRGAGVIIAVVDTGVDLDHEDFASAGKFVAGWDYIDGGQPRDEEGHGTHVAGIAAAVTDNGAGVASVAPDARIMPVRVLDENGSCAGNCSVSAGIRWAVDQGARVINLSLASLGQEVFGPSFSDALEYAWSKGAIPVVAAGNGFLLSSGYEDDQALVVSGTDRNDRKPDFSSGVGQAKWGIAAPGGGDTFDPGENHILSTYWDRNQPDKHNFYAYLRGTSMAAPHVSGAAAVLLGLGLSAQQTVDRLLATAKDIGPAATFGHGRLDLARAVQGLGGSPSSPSPGAPTTTPSPTSTPGTISIIVRPSPGTSPGSGSSPTNNDDGDENPPQNGQTIGPGPPGPGLEELPSPEDPGFIVEGSEEPGDGSGEPSGFSGLIPVAVIVGVILLAIVLGSSREPG